MVSKLIDNLTPKGDFPFSIISIQLHKISSWNLNAVNVLNVLYTAVCEGF